MQLLYAELTYKVRGSFFTVYNNLGYGHKEQVYQKALEIEFKRQNVPYKREVNVDVFYSDEVVGHYRPDFIIDGKILIELKAVEFMHKSFETQLIHYLKSTKFNVGVLVNFGSEKLYIKRLVWTTSDPRESANNP